MLGFAVAVVLLVSVGLTVWVELLFPAWILLLSVDILRTATAAIQAATMASTLMQRGPACRTALTAPPR